MYAVRGRVILKDSVMYGNEAGANGGAVALDTNNVMKVVNCTFRGNTAVTGGAIYVGRSSDAEIHRAQFGDNSAL